MNSSSRRAVDRRLGRRHQRLQLVGDHLGEQQEVHPVLGRGVDEELALLRELVEAGDRPHLVLHRGDPHVAYRGGRVGRDGARWLSHSMNTA